MKVNMSWLRELLQLEVLDVSVLAKKLVMAGLEIADITSFAPAFTGICIGQVLKVAQHPNADKLKVCVVAIDETGTPLQIVCGASNVSPGIKVAVAQIGAVLPNQIKIKRAKLRNVVSEGMLCSAEELGLAEKSEGILILPEEATIGLSIREYLDLDDQIIEVELTPNRSDCLSVWNLAKEIAILLEKPYEIPVLSPSKKQREQLAREVDFAVLPPESCAVYVMAGFSLPENFAATLPRVYAKRLQAAGFQSLHPVVDLLNYVMLETGQPLHAFDADRVIGPLCVRYAEVGERLILLNGKTLLLQKTDLVIADQQQVLALAGVMGGLAAAVTENTRHFLLESAHFSSSTLAASIRFHRLQTEAGHRFERLLPQGELQKTAIFRSLELLETVLNAENTIWFSVRTALPVLIEPIHFVIHNIQRILGIRLSIEAVCDYLQRLGCTIQDQPNADDTLLKVQPPIQRLDITTEIDLIEEIARLHGYDNIPLIEPPLAWPQLEKTQHLSFDFLLLLKQCCVDWAYTEVINYAFTDPEKLKKMFPTKDLCYLQNAISPQTSAMRTSLWPGLIQTYQYNFNRQQQRIRCFEMGVCFEKQGDSVKETSHLAGIVAGTLFPLQWGVPEKAVDFFDMKQDVFTILEHCGLTAVQLKQKASECTALHPGQSADVYWQDQLIASYGQLHPDLAQAFGLKTNVYLFDIALEQLPSVSPLPIFVTPAKYPAVKRDLALVLPKKVAVAEITHCMNTVLHPYLFDIELFDIYESEALGLEKQSLAFSLCLQDNEKTLADTVVDGLLKQLLEKLEKDFNVHLRD